MARRGGGFLNDAEKTLVYNAWGPGLASPGRNVSVTDRRVEMSVTEHVEALRAKHAELEHLIDEEEHRPHPDDLVITELKRQKLRIKDQIATLSRQ